MVLKVESSGGRPSLDLLKGWKGRDEGKKLIVQSTAATTSQHPAVPRCAATDPTFNELMNGGVYMLFGQDFDHEEDRSKESSSWVTVAEVSRPPSTNSRGFKFTQFRSGQTFQLTLRPLPSNPTNSQAFKRRRHGLDVDGPNTAALCCKKRRLREKLITSRLSQPYSQPATHILNREGQKQGDKRFSKMATSIEVARRHAHLQSTSFLRYSMMNRLRQRLGLGRPLAQEDNDALADDDEDLDTSTKAPWKTQGGSSQATTVGKQPSARPVRNAHGPNGADAYPPRPVTPPRLQPARLSKPAALPLPPSDIEATKARTSARIDHPVRSPELRPEKGAYEELEEDGFAFLHGDDEGLNDVTDDPDHVYSDFSVIFGGGGSGNGSQEAHSQDENYSYEEYLDELDGISWVTM